MPNRCLHWAGAGDSCLMWSFMIYRFLAWSFPSYRSACERERSFVSASKCSAVRVTPAYLRGAGVHCCCASMRRTAAFVRLSLACGVPSRSNAFLGTEGLRTRSSIVAGRCTRSPVVGGVNWMRAMRRCLVRLLLTSIDLWSSTHFVAQVIETVVLAWRSHVVGLRVSLSRVWDSL